eukprot:3388330-Lingulodinium_polyedra.AAC.1
MAITPTQLRLATRVCWRNHGRSLTLCPKTGCQNWKWPRNNCIWLAIAGRHTATNRCITIDVLAINARATHLCLRVD